MGRSGLRQNRVLSAGRGIALREVPLQSGRCDYLLLADRNPLGVLEARKKRTLLSIEPDDFDYAPFSQRGGFGRAHQLFGEQLPNLIKELNQVLAA